MGKIRPRRGTTSRQDIWTSFSPAKRLTYCRLLHRDNAATIPTRVNSAWHQVGLRRRATTANVAFESSRLATRPSWSTWSAPRWQPHMSRIGTLMFVWSTELLDLKLLPVDKSYEDGSRSALLTFSSANRSSRWESSLVTINALFAAALRHSIMVPACMLHGA